MKQLLRLFTALGVCLTLSHSANALEMVANPIKSLALISNHGSDLAYSDAFPLLGMALLIPTDEAISQGSYVFNEVEKKHLSRQQIKSLYGTVTKEIEVAMKQLREKKISSVASFTKTKNLETLMQVEKTLLEKTLSKQLLNSQFPEVSQEELFAIILQRASSISSRR